MNIIEWIENEIFIKYSINHTHCITNQLIDDMYTQIFKPYEIIDNDTEHKHNPTNNECLVHLDSIIELEGRLGIMNCYKKDNQGERPTGYPDNSSTLNINMNTGFIQLTHKVFEGNIKFNPELGDLRLFEMIRNWIELNWYQNKLKFYNSILLKYEPVIREAHSIRQWTIPDNNNRLEEIIKIDPMISYNQQQAQLQLQSQSTNNQPTASTTTSTSTSTNQEKKWVVTTKKPIMIGYNPINDNNLNPNLNILYKQKKNIDIITCVPSLYNIDHVNGYEYRINLNSEYQTIQSDNGVVTWEINVLNNQQTQSGSAGSGSNNNTSTRHQHVHSKKDKLSNHKRKREEKQINEMLTKENISKTNIVLRHKRQHLSYKIGAWQVDLSAVATSVDDLPSKYINHSTTSTNSNSHKKSKCDGKLLEEHLEVEVELNLKHVAMYNTNKNPNEIILKKETCIVLIKELLILLTGINMKLGEFLSIIHPPQQQQ